MLPVLFHVGDVAVPTHEVFTMLGVGVALLLFHLEARRLGMEDERLWQVAAGALLGGAIFAKLGTSWQYLQAEPDPSLGGLWLYGGKTVLGGLAGAYLGALVAKRIVGERRSTGDAFAPAVCAGIAVGRIGCFLTEQIGTPTTLPWGIRVGSEVAERIPGCEGCGPGVAMHPSFLYEIALLFALFVVLRRLRGRIPVPGELFKLFLLAYGTFRFFVEFVRANPETAFGLSGSQIFLAGTLPLLVAYFVRQVRRGAYRPVSAPAPREVLA